MKLNNCKLLAKLTSADRAETQMQNFKVAYGDVSKNEWYSKENRVSRNETTKNSVIENEPEVRIEGCRERT